MNLPYSLNDITSFIIIGKKKVALINADDDTIDSFRVKMDFMVIEAAKRYAAPGCDWNLFEPGESNLLFPQSINGVCFQYVGFGELLSYNVKTLKSLLAVSRCETEKDVIKVLKGRSFCDKSNTDEISALRIHYKDDTTLEINCISKRVTWLNNGKSISNFELTSEESSAELLSALEQYIRSGELNQKYALHLIKPLGLEAVDLDLNQRGSFLENMLGL